MNSIFERMIDNAESNGKEHENNMSLWLDVSVTDPRFTRRVNTRGGFTAIDAYSQIMIATTQWGIFGHGWGIKNEEFSMLTEGLLIYTAILFYPSGTKTIETEIHSSISTAFTTSDGQKRLDDDCVKKVATDALTKGLSKLGFNADVFLGLYDDNKYVAEAKAAFETKRFVAVIKEIQTKIPESEFIQALKVYDVKDIKELAVDNRVRFYTDLKTYDESLNGCDRQLRAA
jgi:hypothetical protein